MTLEEFVVAVEQREDPAELRQFVAGIRASVASDPDFALATTLDGWKGELEAWRCLRDIILVREEGSLLSLNQFVAALEGIEHSLEVTAFAAFTREEARHDATWPLVRRIVDWRVEFECWRGMQQLVRRGALLSLTPDQLRALGVKVD